LRKAGVEVPKTASQLLDTLEKIQAVTDEKLYFQSGRNTPVFLHRTYDSWPFFVDLNEQIFKVDQDGNVESWIESEEFKEDSQFFRKMYENGLIHPDILTIQKADIQNFRDNGDYLANDGGMYAGYLTLQKVLPDVEPLEFYLAPEKPLLQIYAFGNTN